jgi:hypothetical protein
MIAVFCRFADPQFADYAAFWKNVLHYEDLLDIVVNKTFLVASSLAAGMTSVARALESDYDVVVEQNFGKPKH